MIAASTLLLAVILSLVGAELPADTHFLQAFALWLIIVGTAVALMTIVDDLLRGVLEETGLSAVIVGALTGGMTVLIVALPLALMCLPIDGLMPDEDLVVGPRTDSVPIVRLLWAWADQYLNLLPATAGVWLFITAVGKLVPEGVVADTHRDAIDPDLRTAVEEGETADAQASSDLERRHPDIAGESLLAIEADEHYVRFHTEASSRHVLYRFRDALKDVEGMPGLQVHRSWWVSADAIEGAERNGSAFGLKLSNGLVVPVSQTYRREVERLLEQRVRTP